jgi:hypothetical protein
MKAPSPIARLLPLLLAAAIASVHAEPAAAVDKDRAWQQIQLLLNRQDSIGKLDAKIAALEQQMRLDPAPDPAKQKQLDGYKEDQARARDYVTAQRRTIGGLVAQKEPSRLCSLALLVSDHKDKIAAADLEVLQLEASGKPTDSAEATAVEDLIAPVKLKHEELQKLLIAEKKRLDVRAGGRPK